MNDIDRRIMHAVRDWYTTHKAPPALCVVHPILYRNKTIYDVRLPLIPELNLSLSFTKELTGPPPSIKVATTRIVEMNTRDQWIPPEQWIMCLSDMQVMHLLEAMPYLRGRV